MLASIVLSGGFLLGAWTDEAMPPRLVGALLDLLAEVDGYPALHTVYSGVEDSALGRGIGTALRSAERAFCGRRGIDLVLWGIDPLRGRDAHVALNKLGAVGTQYRRNMLGPLHDRANAGLATDRLTIEWWIESPRVTAVLDAGEAPPHHDLGLHRMDVITKTRVLPSGMRALIDVAERSTGSHVLVEVPVDLDALRAADPGIAREWRIGTRGLFEDLLGKSGYTAVGFIHEAGRSFHLLERCDKGQVLAG